jgi:hypothetical protein
MTATTLYVTTLGYPEPDRGPLQVLRSPEPGAPRTYAGQATDADWAYARMLYDFHLAPGNLFERAAFAMFDAGQVPA